MCIPAIVGSYGLISIMSAMASTAAEAAPTVALATSVAGAGVSAVSAYQQGETAKKAADTNTANQNATAISVENQGAQESADQLMKAKRIEASQVAAAGAGGVSPSSGTPLAMEGQTAEFGELDALRIINNASRSAWGLQTQADITSYEGSQQQQASYLNAGSSLLGGMSNAYFGYKKAI